MFDIYSSISPTPTGFYLGFLLGEEVDHKKIVEPRSGEKIFFLPSRGVRGHAPQENFEKIVFRIG